MSEGEENALCFACAEDRFLAAIIQRSGSPVKCSICEREDRKAFTVEQLAAVLEPVMQDNFELAPPQIYSGYPEHGDDMRFVVEHVLGQELEFIDELIAEICDKEDNYPEEPFWSADDGSYVENRVHIPFLHRSWTHTLEDLKLGRRFFSPTAQALFSDLFQGVGELRDGEEPVIRELTTDAVFYRARITDFDTSQKIADAPYREVGPPPAWRARAGRMNADGIVVFYGALEPETSVAELRPAIGNEIAVIAVRPTRALKILDFGRLERARTAKNLSYFMPDRATIVRRHHFLRELHSLITLPVVPGKEPDYLITQAMAEYLDHVHVERFDGVLFKSAQEPRGTNIVLFPEPDTLEPRTDFNIEYVPDSLHFRGLASVKYESEVRRHSIQRDGQLWFDDWDHEED